MRNIDVLTAKVPEKRAKHIGSELADSKPEQFKRCTQST